MEKNIDNDKNEIFYDVLYSKESSDSNIEQKILFVTTDSWLAQLGSRKK